MADMAQQPAGALASQPNQDPASQLLAMQKKKRLAGMDMPGASTAPEQGDAAPQAAGTAPALPARPSDSSAPGYTDPDTGETTNDEPGAQEGELYSDYVMPLKSMFTGGAAAVGNIVAKKGVQALKDRMPSWSKGGEESEDSPAMNYGAMQPAKNTAQGPGLIYSNQQGPGTVTDATNGFKPGKGYQIRNR